MARNAKFLPRQITLTLKNRVLRVILKYFQLDREKAYLTNVV